MSEQEWLQSLRELGEKLVAKGLIEGNGNPLATQALDFLYSRLKMRRRKGVSLEVCLIELSAVYRSSPEKLIAHYQQLYS